MAQHGNLFNPKTIKRLCKDIRVTTKQKQSAKEWLRMLDSEKLKKEKGHYIDFAVTVLRDILGYPIKTTEGMLHEEGNVEFVFINNEGKKIVCFEAKGTKNKDLFATQYRQKKEHSTPIKQTWDYMGNIGLDYGVCTNYKDFVLITKQGYSKYYKFDFNSIKEDDEKLKEFIGIFSKERIIDLGFIEELTKKSIVEEREFTEEFYKLYHETRLMLIKAFQEKENVSKTESIYYTQIFLNRLIFIFFVEDRGYLSDNRLFSNRLLKMLDSQQSTEHSKKIYDEMTELFIAFDKGSPSLGVFGFNGELFNGVFPQKIYFSDLKNPNFFSDVRQNSNLLKSTKLNESAAKIINKYQNQLNPIISNLLIMDSFDFNSEVNVKILGHIFEQSISDLEELKSEKISRRKREGIVYTPEYITEYICNNTIIPYLSKSSVSTIPELIQEYAGNIEELEEKFKEIKILDPACGSGAFLVQAIDLLLDIFSEIQILKESSGKYTAGEQFQLTKWNEESLIRMIIENNIYGVDINRESVEITRLSLFLKLASKNRKLIGLSKNIKVGNSLIDDKSVDPRAFSWEKEFPEIMEYGKFDIVIGNPPYVRMEEFKEIKSSLKKNFKTHAERADLYVYFYEKGFNLLKEDGIFGVISSNTFMRTNYGENLREFLHENTQLQRILYLGETQFFKDVTTYPGILFFKKVRTPDKNKLVPCFSKRKLSVPENFLYEIEQRWKQIPQKNLDSKMWIFADAEDEKIHQKIHKESVLLKQYYGEPLRGIVTGLNNAFIIDEKTMTKLVNEDSKSMSIIKPFLMGRDLKRWFSPDSKKFIIYSTKNTKIDNYVGIKKHLQKFEQDLRKRAGKQEWWELQQPQENYIPSMEGEKIIWGDITNEPTISLDLDLHYFANSVYFIPKNDRHLLCLLNSNLCKWFMFFSSRGYQGGFVTFRNVYVEKIPVKKPTNEEEKKFLEFSEVVISSTKILEKTKLKFINRLTSNFGLKKISNSLQVFWTLTFNELQNELKKNSSIKLSPKEQDQWEDYFNENKLLVTKSLEEIEKIEEKIDDTVYNMYGIAEKEKKRMENFIEQF